MACPKLLFLTVFLLLLSFWVDLCHQSNDEEDDDDGYSSWEALLEENKLHSNVDTHRNCCFCSASQIESRQKVVILVTALVFVLMLAAAVLIWIGRGKSPIDSSVVARAYVDLFAILVLLLVAALAYYGLVLFLKMSRVRSERASSEIWKVAGLAIVSVLCFTSSSFISIFTDVPLLYNNWSEQNINVVSTSLLVVLYYFVGSSVPSAFVLWVMRELPPVVTQRQQEPSTIAFITDSTSTSNPQRWTTVASLQN